MRQLMNFLSTLMQPSFINSLPGIGIVSMFVHLLVNILTKDLWRIINCAGATRSIMVKMTVQLLNYGNDGNVLHYKL